MTSLNPVVLLLVLVAVSSSQPTGSKLNILDEILKRVLDGLRPKLKDLQIPKQDIEVNIPEANITLGFDNGLVKHLDEFNIVKLTTCIIPPRVTNLTVTLDEVSITGLYNLSGYVSVPDAAADIHIYGNGDAQIEFKGIFFTIAADFVFEEGKLQVPKDGLHDFDMYLQESKFNLTNLMGGGAVGDSINAVISNEFPNFLQENKNEIWNYLKERLRAYINSLLDIFGLPKSDFPTPLPDCN